MPVGEQVDAANGSDGYATSAHAPRRARECSDSV